MSSNWYIRHAWLGLCTMALVLAMHPHTAARSMSTPQEILTLLHSNTFHCHHPLCIITPTPTPGTRHLPATMRRLTQGPGTWNNDADCSANYYFLQLENPLYSGYCLSQFDNQGLDIRIMPCQKTVGQLWSLNYENLQLGGSTAIRNVASQLQIARCLQVWDVMCVVSSLSSSSSVSSSSSQQQPCITSHHHTHPFLSEPMCIQSQRLPPHNQHQLWFPPRQ